METIKHVINDQSNWWSPVHPEEEAIVELLTSRNVDFTNLDGWRNLDAHEQSLGAPEGRARVKVVPRDEMVAVSNGR
jgi:ferredoxin--NADP+ reductase